MRNLPHFYTFRSAAFLSSICEQNFPPSDKRWTPYISTITSISSALKNTPKERRKCYVERETTSFLFTPLSQISYGGCLTSNLILMTTFSFSGVRPALGKRRDIGVRHRVRNLAVLIVTKTDAALANCTSRQQLLQSERRQQQARGGWRVQRS